MSKELMQNIDGLYQRIREILDNARNKVYRSANIEMVQAYWNVGREIMEEEQKGKERAEYGKHLIKEISRRLTKEYGKGFDSRNLYYMRRFYTVFPNLNALRSELSWTHYRLLMQVEREEARKFYISEAIEGNWGTRQLERQISSLYYDRILMSKDKRGLKEDTNRMFPGMNPKEIIKDPYVLEFLDIKENTKIYETALEQALIDKLQDFLLELGKGFAFVARQYRIPDNDKHYRIDLVFYNYILKCFLVIDLKTRALNHEDIGQMDFYVRYFEDNMKQEWDNPTIGLILCTQKSKTIVKYSLLNDSKQIFASKYQLYLPTEKQLKEEIEREKEQIELEKKLKKLSENNESGE